MRKKTTAVRKPYTRKPAVGIVIKEPEAVDPQPAPTHKRTRNVIFSHNEDEDDEDSIPISVVLKKQKIVVVATDVFVPTKRRQPSRKA